MNPDFLLQAVAKKQAEVAAEEQTKEQAEKQFTMEQFRSVVKAMSDATTVLIRFLNTYEPTTTVKNFPESFKTPDVKDVVKAVKGLEKTLKPQALDNTDVINAIKELKTCIEGMEKPSESVSIANPQDITKDLTKAIEGLQMRLDKIELSPKISVPKPQVTVQPTDVKSIVKELKAVKQEVIDKPVPGTTVVQTDPLIRYTPADIDDATDIQYFGNIAADTSYYIRRFDKSSNPKTIRFYFGKGDYAAAWAARASKTYTLWSE